MHDADRYIQETQKLSNEEIPLQSPSFYSTLDTMHMDDTVRKHLEASSHLIFLSFSSFRAHNMRVVA